MPLRLVPDSEALVIAYLKGHESVVAIAGDQVATELGDDFPAVTVRLVTGRELVRTHLDEQHLQVDSWADDKATASLLARTLRAALLDAAEADHAHGVVTDVRTISPPHWLPDDTDDDRPRYVQDVGVVLHPHPM